MPIIYMSFVFQVTQTSRDKNHNCAGQLLPASRDPSVSPESLFPTSRPSRHSTLCRIRQHILHLSDRVYQV